MSSPAEFRFSPASESPASEDTELLRRYAEEGSQVAFAELVRRRIGLVYSVALRQTHGDAHRAQDATQAVFTDLARKARVLAARPVLVGWLYRSAQFAAAGLIRTEQRRQAREQEAHIMEEVSASHGLRTEWERVRPVLDEALNEMEERDRDAILLRFFDERPFAEIGARLRLSENGARMRVDRALDKLNAALARRGITSTSAAIGMALANQIGTAMPAGLAASVTSAALAQTTAAGATGWLAAVVGATKVQLGLAGAVMVAAGAMYVAQAANNRALRQEMAALQESQRAAAELRIENQQLARAAAEVETLRRDDTELARLAQAVAAARKLSEESAARARRDTIAQNVQAEIDRMNREGNALVEDFKALTAQSKDTARSAAERAQAETDAKLKLQAIQAKQREIKAFIENARRENPDLPEPPRSRYRVSESSGEQRAMAPGDRVSLHLPGADLFTAFSALEKFTGITVTADPSIAGIKGTINLQTPPSTREEALQLMRTALQQQLNIVLEPTADGKYLARVGASR